MRFEKRWKNIAGTAEGRGCLNVPGGKAGRKMKHLTEEVAHEDLSQVGASVRAALARANAWGSEVMASWDDGK